MVAPGDGDPPPGGWRRGRRRAGTDRPSARYRPLDPPPAPRTAAVLAVPAPAPRPRRASGDGPHPRQPPGAGRPSGRRRRGRRPPPHSARLGPRSAPPSRHPGAHDRARTGAGAGGPGSDRPTRGCARQVPQRIRRPGFRVERIRPVRRRLDAIQALRREGAGDLRHPVHSPDHARHPLYGQSRRDHHGPYRRGCRLRAGPRVRGRQPDQHPLPGTPRRSLPAPGNRRRQLRPAPVPIPARRSPPGQLRLPGRARGGSGGDPVGVGPGGRRSDLAELPAGGFGQDLLAIRHAGPRRRGLHRRPVLLPLRSRALLRLPPHRRAGAHPERGAVLRHARSRPHPAVPLHDRSLLASAGRRPHPGRRRRGGGGGQRRRIGMVPLPAAGTRLHGASQRALGGAPVAPGPRRDAGRHLCDRGGRHRRHLRSGASLPEWGQAQAQAAEGLGGSAPARPPDVADGDAPDLPRFVVRRRGSGFGGAHGVSRGGERGAHLRPPRQRRRRNLPAPLRSGRGVAQGPAGRIAHLPARARLVRGPAAGVGDLHRLPDARALRESAAASQRGHRFHRGEKDPGREPQRAHLPRRGPLRARIRWGFSTEPVV